MMQTLRYKNGYIHFSIIGRNEVIRVQFGDYPLVTVKSFHAAKLLIARLNNGTFVQHA